MDLIEPQKDSVSCKVCLNILDDPVCCKQCNDLFCSQCAKSLNGCPSCKSNLPFKKFKMHKITKSLFDTLKFNCPFKEHGCTETPVQSDQLSHIKKCFTCEKCHHKTFEEGHNEIQCQENIIKKIMEQFTRLLSNVDKFKQEIQEFILSNEKLSHAVQNNEQKIVPNQKLKDLLDDVQILGDLRIEENKQINNQEVDKQSIIKFNKDLLIGKHTFKLRITNFIESQSIIGLGFQNHNDVNFCTGLDLTNKYSININLLQNTQIKTNDLIKIIKESNNKIQQYINDQIVAESINQTENINQFAICLVNQCTKIEMIEQDEEN